MPFSGFSLDIFLLLQFLLHPAIWCIIHNYQFFSLGLGEHILDLSRFTPHASFKGLIHNILIYNFIYEIGAEIAQIYFFFSFDCFFARFLINFFDNYFVLAAVDNSIYSFIFPLSEF